MRKEGHTGTCNAQEAVMHTADGLMNRDAFKRAILGGFWNKKD